MAKYNDKNEDQSLPGDEHISEIEAMADQYLPNQDEIVSIHSNILGRTVHIRRRDVYKQASVMASNNQVACLFGIDRKTIKAHFSKELDMARAYARQKLIARFYNLAVYGTNPADRIFALKNWAGLTDQGLTEELDDMEEGVEFKVRRPQKPIEQTKEAEALEVVNAEEDSEEL